MQRINKKGLLIIFFVLLLSILSFISYNYFDTNMKKKEEDINNVLNLTKSLKADQNRIHIFDEFKISSNIVLNKLSDFDSDEVTISELDLKKPKIVFRFSDLSCESCINQEISNLNALAKEIGKENIIFLGSFANIRKAISFSKVNTLENSNFYFINYGALGSNLEREHLPFVFILDQSMRINTPFFPRYDLPEVSVDYYKIIKQKYFVNKRVSDLLK